MAGGGDPLYLKFWVNRTRWSKFADFEPIIARSASAVTPSEKNLINANRKSNTRFPMSLRWSSYVARKSPKESLNNAKWPISVKKIALRLKKVCYKVSLCENWERQSCKAFIGLTNREKNDWWGATTCTWNFGLNWPRRSEIAHFRSLFARSDSAVTPSAKSSININRKSTTRFSMSPRWTSYVFNKPPRGGSKT